MTAPGRTTVNPHASHRRSALRHAILPLVMTMGLACATPKVAPKTTAEATPLGVAPAISRQVNAPRAQLPEADHALAFLGRFEAAVRSRQHEQVAALISADFVQFKAGEPLGEEAIEFIDSLFCGYSPTEPASWSMHCVELRHVDALSLQALDFYAQDAWQLTYVLTGRSPQFSEPVTLEIALSLTKEEVAGQGNTFRLMGPAG